MTSTGFNLKIKSVQSSSKFGLMTYNPFDLYFFDGNNDDYECFVEKSNKWARHQIAEFCDFVTKAKWVHPNLYEYSLEQKDFLNYEATHTDFFMVIDNSGWYGSISNEQAENPSTGDVIFDLEVTTEYQDNDFFNFVFLGACAFIGILIFTLLVTLCAYKYQRVQYNKISEELKEFKQSELLQREEQLGEDMNILRAQSQHAL